MMSPTQKLNLDFETLRQACCPLRHDGKHNRWRDGVHAFEDWWTRLGHQHLGELYIRHLDMGSAWKHSEMTK